MEGIIDAPADPAFDMIDICANNEDDEDEIIDETLTAKVKSFFLSFFCHFGKKLVRLLFKIEELNRLQGTNFLCEFTFQGFNPLFEYRDLSAWRVNISKVATHRDVNGKNSFFFVIEVQRYGSSDQTPSPESKTSVFFFTKSTHNL